MRIQLLTLVVVIAATAAVATAQEPRGATLYRDLDFQGIHETFTASDSNLRGSLVGNDKASSVRVSPGCRVVLYEDRGYGGRRLELTESAVSLAGTLVGDDEVSSLEVECEAVAPPASPTPAVTLYEHEEFRGRKQSFDDDVANLEGTVLGKDTASSAEVRPGCEVTLYEHKDFGGASTRLSEDIVSLKGTRVGQDSVSSLRVRCPGMTRSPAPALRGVTLYSQTGFRGRSQLFAYDDGGLVDDPIGEEGVLSIRVPAGCRATLYSGVYWRGDSMTVDGDESDLGRTALGDRGVASLRVECR